MLRTGPLRLVAWDDISGNVVRALDLDEARKRDLIDRWATPLFRSFARGAYAGPVGWVDADGNGVWAIALRCALLFGDRATLYAGAGIVGGSEPMDELDETDRKFRAFLDALRWG